MSIRPLDPGPAERLRAERAPRLAADLARVMVFTLVLQSCTAAAMLVLTHALTQEQYGAYATALTLQSYLFLVGSFGIKPVVVREVILRPQHADRMLTAHGLFAGAAASALALALAGVLLVVPVAPDRAALFGLVAVGNVATCLAVAPLFDAHRRQAVSMAIATGAELAWLAAVLGLAAGGRLSLPVVGATVVAKAALNAAVHGLVYHAAVRPVRVALVPGDLAVLLRAGWWLMASNLLATVPFSLGVVLVWAWVGEREAAVSGIAFQVGAAYLALAAVANRVLQPHIARTYRADRTDVRRVALVSAAFLAAVWCAAVLGTGVLAAWLLPSGYRAAFLPTVLVLTGAAVQGAGAVAGAYLIAWAKESYVMAAHAAAAVLFVTGSAALASHYDAVTAAAVTLTAAAVGAAAMILFAVRCRPGRSINPPGNHS